MSKKPNAGQFKPGISGNPGGRPPLPPDLKEARKLNQIELERLLNKFLTFNKSQLEAHIKDPFTPSLELLICQIIAKGIINGDPVRMDYLVSRVIGKMKERHEVDMRSEIEVDLKGLPKNAIEAMRKAVKKKMHGSTSDQ